MFSFEGEKSLLWEACFPSLHLSYLTAHTGNWLAFHSGTTSGELSAITLSLGWGNETSWDGSQEPPAVLIWSLGGGWLQKGSRTTRTAAFPIYLVCSPPLLLMLFRLDLQFHAAKYLFLSTVADQLLRFPLTERWVHLLIRTEVIKCGSWESCLDSCSSTWEGTLF